MRINDNGIMRNMTAEEEAVYIALNTPTTEERIAELKAELANLDYKDHKYIEGELSEEEFREVCKIKKALRAEINRLENEA